MDTAKALRTLKAHTGKTNEDIATITGVSKTSVSNWMNGHQLPSILTLARLCEKLNVKLSTMVSWGEEK